MNVGCDELWQELSTMADEFADLGRRLLHASRRMHAPGAIPPESIFEDADKLRREFGRIRERTRSLAESLDVPIPDVAALESLQAVARLLEAVEDAADSREDRDARVQKTEDVLETVPRLKTPNSDHPAPRGTCQEEARSLRDLGSSDLPAATDELVDSLETMYQPVTSLLSAVNGASGVCDWTRGCPFESVATTHPRPLNATASRGPITIGDSKDVPAGTEPEEIGLASSPSHSQPPLDLPRPDGGPCEIFLHANGKGPIGPPHDSGFLDPILLSDKALAAYAQETVPWLPRGHNSLLTVRRIARVARRNESR